jgi:hypothetical protein
MVGPARHHRPVVSRHPDRAVRRPCPVERNAAVVEMPRAIPSLNRIACRRHQTEERRGLALRRGVGRVTRQQAVRPRAAAIRRVVHAGPRIAGRGNGAVIVCTGRHVRRSARIDGRGRLVLLAFAACRRARVVGTARNCHVGARSIPDIRLVTDLDVGRRGHCKEQRKQSDQRRGYTVLLHKSPLPSWLWHRLPEKDEALTRAATVPFPCGSKVEKALRRPALPRSQQSRLSRTSPTPSVRKGRSAFLCRQPSVET